MKRKKISRLCGPRLNFFNSLSRVIFEADDIYSYFGSGMDISKDKFKSEVKRWKQKWSGKNANVTPKTFVETIDHDNRQFHPWEFMLTLLTYPMSTCTAERSFSSMKRLKTPLRSFVWAFSISTMTDGRLRSIAILHIHKHKDVDIDVITEFARLNKGRRLGLCL